MTTPHISPVTHSSPSFLWEPQKHLPTPHTQQNIQTITKRFRKKKKKGEREVHTRFCLALNLWELPTMGTVTPPKEMFQVRVEG